MSASPSDQNSAAPGQDQIQISECLPSDPDASELLSDLYREQLGRYGFADPPELDPRHYTPPHGIFVIVRHGAVLLGCGGYRWFDRPARTVEIKRLYLVPAARSYGTGRVLLSWLEQHAASDGAQRAILETGVRNTAAIGLFTAVGYRPIDRYVPGRNPDVNRAFARSLTGPA